MCTKMWDKKVEDTKEIIGIRMSRKDKQYRGQTDKL
jgi:hypothetical protein